MGTIRIEEYNAIGSVADRNSPVNDLNALITTTVDATTSTTAESITLGEYTKLVTINAVEDHRVALKSDTTATVYSFIPAGAEKDFGVKPGQVLYYRADA